MNDSNLPSENHLSVVIHVGYNEKIRFAPKGKSLFCEKGEFISMKVIRKTKTLCPICLKDLEGLIVQIDDKVYLSRDCPDHGSYKFLLSCNGDLYSDLERFYFDVLKGDETKGRITNFWIAPTYKCQMKCKYCQTRVETPFFEEMSMDDLRYIFQKYKDAKLTLAGGEPTLHPEVCAFFREAAARKLVTQLSTNAVKLADENFCRMLVDSKVKEVRISLESFDREETDRLGTEAFYDAKLKAIRNLEKLNIVTILSPTIFKGINENQLVKSLEYAKNKPFIRELSVNGFSWVGQGTDMDKRLMIMPDEMMDILFQRYFKSDREDIFTFQKMMLVALQLAGIRLCLYTHLMIFVREGSELVPITDFLDMKRLKAGITWWERFSKSSFFLQAVSFLITCLGCLRYESRKIFFPAVLLFLANVFKVRIGRYPQKLVPIVLNTNCSVLSADEMVGLQCMSGILYKRNGRIVQEVSSRSLLAREKDKITSMGSSEGETAKHVT